MIDPGVDVATVVALTATPVTATPVTATPVTVITQIKKQISGSEQPIDAD